MCIEEGKNVGTPLNNLRFSFLFAMSVTENAVWKCFPYNCDILLSTCVSNNFYNCVCLTYLSSFSVIVFSF